MEFREAMEIIRHVVEGLEDAEYDGIIVKRLEASNTLDEGRRTNQTHIAICGQQMNMFPHLRADGYFECDYSDRDETLKKYFIARIPLCIYKTNMSYLGVSEFSGYDFDEDGSVEVKACIVRSRRKSQADQVQLSLTSLDDPTFVSFRRLIHTGDYLIILKHREKLKYDCFGVRAGDESEGEYTLADLNNKFFNLPTNTKLDIDKTIELKVEQCEKEDYTIKELAEVLKYMYNSAEDGLKVASIHIFGIKYGMYITKNKFSSKQLISEAGLNNSYITELQKALKIFQCICNNEYGISFHNAIKKVSEMGDRKTGAENILLYGVPGAGKSHLIKTEYCTDESYMERVVFHPDYTYSDFVGQILPRVEQTVEGDKLKYIFTPGPFTRLLTKAQSDCHHFYYLIIEELNRGNAPAIFGEIFQLLDRKDEGDYPDIEVGESEYGISNYDIAKEVYSDPAHMVRIPSNMYILATMNTADQNVFALDTAFQRRWNMKQIKNDFKNARYVEEIIEGTSISWGSFATVVNEMVIDSNTDMISSEDKRLGTYFVRKKELSPQYFPEKVLKYLWDDAFKMDRDIIFKSECNSLEKVIVTYENTTKEDKLKAVLRAEVYKKMIDKMAKQEKQDI